MKAQEDADGSVPVTTPETPSQPDSWKKSITKHHVTCLECGARLNKIYSHLIEHFISTHYTFSVASDLPRMVGHVSCKPR